MNRTDRGRSEGKRFLGTEMETFLGKLVAGNNDNNTIWSCKAFGNPAKTKLNPKNGNKAKRN